MSRQGASCIIGCSSIPYGHSSSASAVSGKCSVSCACRSRETPATWRSNIYRRYSTWLTPPAAPGTRSCASTGPTVSTVTRTRMSRQRCRCGSSPSCASPTTPPMSTCSRASSRLTALARSWPSQTLSSSKIDRCGALHHSCT